MNGPNKTIYRLASKKTALFLFILLAVLLSAQTFFPGPKNSIPLPTRITLLMLAVNLAACTWLHKNRLQRDVLLIHIGCLVIFAGSQLSAAGYIATINIYESDSSPKAYRWDLEQDKGLGFDLAVVKIHQQFYPTPVKIGILQNGKKKKLIETHTDSKFQFGPYDIEIVSIDYAKKNLSLRIFLPQNKGTVFYNTTKENNLPSDFPLDFQLVAYKDPVEQRVWVDLELLQDGTPFAKGITAVNSPFIHGGLRFYHTSTGRDRDGRKFAGIQIVKDPGISVVYLGFFITVAAGLMLLVRKMRPRSKTHKKPDQRPTNHNS